MRSATWQLDPCPDIIAVLRTEQLCAVQALFSGPLGFLQPVPLIKYALMSGLAGTERKRYRVWANQTSTYGSNIPSQTITILLGTVFRWAAVLLLPDGGGSLPAVI